MTQYNKTQQNMGKKGTCWGCIIFLACTPVLTGNAQFSGKHSLQSQCIIIIVIFASSRSSSSSSSSMASPTLNCSHFYCDMVPFFTGSWTDYQPKYKAVCSVFRVQKFVSAVRTMSDMVVQPTASKAHDIAKSPSVAICRWITIFSWPLNSVWHRSCARKDMCSSGCKTSVPESIDCAWNSTHPVSRRSKLPTMTFWNEMNYVMYEWSITGSDLTNCDRACVYASILAWHFQFKLKLKFQLTLGCWLRNISNVRATAISWLWSWHRKQWIPDRMDSKVKFFNETSFSEDNSTKTRSNSAPIMWKAHNCSYYGVASANRNLICCDLCLKAV